MRGCRAAAGLAAPVATLKLHAASEHAGDIPAAVQALRPLELDEIIVEPPWALGVDAARETLGAALAAARA